MRFLSHQDHQGTRLDIVGGAGDRKTAAPLANVLRRFTAGVDPLPPRALAPLGHGRKVETERLPVCIQHPMQGRSQTRGSRCGCEAVGVGPPVGLVELRPRAIACGTYGVMATPSRTISRGTNRKSSGQLVNQAVISDSIVSPTGGFLRKYNNARRYSGCLCGRLLSSLQTDSVCYTRHRVILFSGDKRAQKYRVGDLGDGFDAMQGLFSRQGGLSRINHVARGPLPAIGRQIYPMGRSPASHACLSKRSLCFGCAMATRAAHAHSA